MEGGHGVRAWHRGRAWREDMEGMTLWSLGPYGTGIDEYSFYITTQSTFRLISHKQPKKLNLIFFTISWQKFDYLIEMYQCYMYYVFVQISVIFLHSLESLYGKTYLKYNSWPVLAISRFSTKWNCKKMIKNNSVI